LVATVEKRINFANINKKMDLNLQYHFQLKTVKLLTINRLN